MSQIDRTEIRLYFLDRPDIRSKAKIYITNDQNGILSYPENHVFNHPFDCFLTDVTNVCSEGNGSVRIGCYTSFVNNLIPIGNRVTERHSTGYTDIQSIQIDRVPKLQDVRVMTAQEYQDFLDQNDVQQRLAEFDKEAASLDKQAESLIEGAKKSHEKYLASVKRRFERQLQELGQRPSVENLIETEFFRKIN